MEKRFFSFLFRSKTKEHTREVRQCGNCDKLIGKLEKCCTYKGKTVCEPCYNLLLRFGDEKPSNGTEVKKPDGILYIGILLFIVGLFLSFYDFGCWSWIFIIVGILLALAGLVKKGWKSWVKEMDKDSNSKK